MLRAKKKKKNKLNVRKGIYFWRGGTDDNWDLLEMRRLLNPKP
jgi:hypothetical protein